MASNDSRAKYTEMIKNLTDAEQAALKAEEEKRRKARRSRKLNKLATTHGKPTQPATPFFIFLSEQWKTFPTVKSRSEAAELAKSIGAKWKQLPGQQKEEYKTRYVHSLAQYKNNLQRWESEMHEKGLSDILEKLKPAPKKVTGKLVRKKSKSNGAKVSKKAARAGPAKRKMAAETKVLNTKDVSKTRRRAL